MDRKTFSCLCVAVVSLTAVASAKSPRVRFDMMPVVACRDVTDDAFALMHPDERLLEAKFEISSILDSGTESDLTEYFFRMTSPQQSFHVVDYSPRTTLASGYSGGISIEKKTEDSKGIGLTASGGWESARLTGHGDAGTKNTLTTKYELVAPMESVTAAGTIESGYGVYFKIRRSRQGTLEGAKEYQVVFRSPQDWRGDILHVHCEARGVKRGIVHQLDEETSFGFGQFPIALYLAGDEEAKRIAEQFAASNHKLRTTAIDSRREIKRRSYPTVLHELGGLLELAEPKIPKSWLQQLLSDNAPGHGFENRLPAQVRSAASDYLVAKRALRKLKQ
ncbi:MAG: hypothetical protein H8E66_19465 [Planctomycetes bacterium]|nr:hypothetical protein [Planctomycetota bacterium]